MAGFQKGAPVVLVDAKKLEEWIASSPLPAAEQEYLRKRWLEQILWWDDRSRKAKRRFFWARSIVVCGAALVPFILTISPDDRVFAVIAAFVSAGVAISAGIESLHNWGGIWLEKRNAAEVLKAEGILFLNRAGIYADQAAPFAKFVETVEAKVVVEIGQYVAAAAAAIRGHAAEGTPPDKPASKSGS
ncbi:MAG TPA: DUF4231 domain-containing protein [Thermoanaerobaculia bacterium]